MTNEMTSFLEDLKEVLNKHNAYISAGMVNHFDHEFSILINDEELHIDNRVEDGTLNVEYIDNILNAPQPKLKVG